MAAAEVVVAWKTSPNEFKKDGMAVASKPISCGDGSACCTTPLRFLLLSILNWSDDDGNGNDDDGGRGDNGEICWW